MAEVDVEHDAPSGLSYEHLLFHHVFFILGIAEDYLRAHHGLFHRLVNVVLLAPRLQLFQISGIVNQSVVHLPLGRNLPIYSYSYADSFQLLLVISKVEVLVRVHFEPINLTIFIQILLRSIFNFVFVLGGICWSFPSFWSILNVVVENYLMIHKYFYLRLGHPSLLLLGLLHLLKVSKLVIQILKRVYIVTFLFLDLEVCLLWYFELW